MIRFKKIVLSIIYAVCFPLFIQGGPQILVNDSLKSKILIKIKESANSERYFNSLREEVDPYAAHFRHGEDYNPNLVIGRYLMNRKPGERYTQAIAETDGNFIETLRGNASVPTIVYQDNMEPETASGQRFSVPFWEDMPVYLNENSIELPNPENEAPTEVLVSGISNKINAQINELALKSSILYWLTDDEAYGYLSADLFDQWAKAVYAQSPIDSCSHAGFFSIQSIDDIAYRDIVLTYDFIKDFLKERKYNTSIYEQVFEKLAQVLLTRGYTNTNWSALNSSMLVFAALNIKDKKQRDEYLNYVIKSDTIANKTGQVSLNSLIKRYLTADGFWIESPLQHNHCIQELLLASIACEKNGYAIFKEYPTLLKASYTMVPFVFPDYTLPNYGDTRRQSPSITNLVLAQQAAQMVGSNELKEINEALATMGDNSVDNQSQDWIRLLFESEGTKHHNLLEKWNRTDKIDHSKLYLMRNGVGREGTLMATMHGASYNHNHADALSIELFGAGTLMGIDPGMGADFFNSRHVNYNSQWASHNTVVAAGSSAPERLYKGGVATKNIGQIDLVAMEPEPRKDAVSPHCSFTDAKYFERFTKTTQTRSLSLIKTDADQGYFVDIFRSNNALCNDYIYHNIGSRIEFVTYNNKPVSTSYSPITTIDPDFPGLRYLGEAYGTEYGYSQPFIARFSVPLSMDTTAYMNVHIPSLKDKSYYFAYAPESTTATPPFDYMKTPTLFVRQIGEAWSRPFVYVYEPSTSDERDIVSTDILNKTNLDNWVVLSVKRKNKASEIVLQSNTPQRAFTHSNISFTGHFATVGMICDTLSYLYLGKGKQLQYEKFTLSSEQTTSSAYLSFENGKMYLTSDSPIDLIIEGEGGELTSTINRILTTLPSKKTAKGNAYTIPASSRRELTLTSKTFVPDKKKKTSSRKKRRRRR